MPDRSKGADREETMTGAEGFPAVSLAQAHQALTQKGSPFEIEECVINGTPTRVWKNAPPTFRDLFLTGRGFGDRTFLVYRDDRATYESFARAALAIAETLQELGVRKGDRVALVKRNVPEWPAVFFGTLLLGGIITPLNAWWTGRELEYGLNDSGARAAFFDRESLERLSGHLDNCLALERVFVCRAGEEIAHPKVGKLESILGEVNDWHRLPDRPLPDVAIAPEDDATIFYTSGTTGKPKGALGTHRNSCSNVLAGAFSLARSYVRRGEPVPAPDPNAPQKATLLVVPLFHATGCQATMCPAINTGAKLVFIHKWDPERAMEIIERERITATGGVPTIAVQLLEHPAVAKYDLSSLESVAYGGAPAPPDLPRKLTDRLPKSRPSFGWGMTETSATFTSHIGEDYQLRPQSCGPALPVCDMKIVDGDGRELPAGSVGELWVKGPNVVKGYWQKPEADRESFVDGWLRTGDIARLDDEGFCYIVDRAKDMLIRGGENIYCIEVENAIYEHPAVMDAAVVAIPHHSLGEEPGAVVTLKPGTTVGDGELRAFVAERLAAFKVPVKIMFSEGVLSRNAYGMSLKGELRSLFLERAV
jgi:long-chain acyl-CoA synthetase